MQLTRDKMPTAKMVRELEVATLVRGGASTWHTGGPILAPPLSISHKKIPRCSETP